MRLLRSRGEPRLVWRFAAYAALVLVAALAVALPLARQGASSSAHLVAERDADFIAELFARNDLSRVAFDGPATGSTRTFLDDFFYGNLGRSRVVQVSLYDRSGRVTYASNQGLVGTHGDASIIARALRGGTAQRVTDGPVGGPARVLRSYVSVRWLMNTSPVPNGVLAVDEDYGPVAAAARGEFRRQAAITGFGLLGLYLALLPLMRRMTVTLRTRNAQLNEQASELERAVAAQQAAAAAARASEARYRALTEQASDAIFVCDADAVVVELNDKACELLGRPGDEARGLPFADVVGAELSFDALGPRETMTAAQRLPRAGGAGVDGELHAARLDDGRILVSVRDVTDRNRLEAELREAHKLDAVGRLAEGVAHEFNNLLTAIGGQGDLLLDRLAPDDPLRTGAEEIKKASEQGMAFARRLLGFSSHRVGPVEAVDVGELVGSTERLLRRLVGENVELVVRADGAGSVLADRAGLERALVGLVGRARSALTRGGRIVIAAADADIEEPVGGLAAGRYVAIQVSDSGQGPDPERRARELDGDAGLAAARAFAEEAGGAVAVESTPGLGTTVVVYLPRIRAAAPGALADAPRPATGVERVLLVEDEEVVRAVVRQFLEHQGYEVFAAGDADQALRLCDEHDGRIDLLVTDIVLPGVGGAELATRLQALAGPGLAVLFTSGYPDNAEVVREILDCGFAFVQKPFTRDDFVRRVRDVLDGPRVPMRAVGV
jgi:two-component system cell cycle sensor histidine kinase/response regulator CckA